MYRLMATKPPRSYPPSFKCEIRSYIIQEDKRYFIFTILIGKDYKYVVSHWPANPANDVGKDFVARVIICLRF